MLTNVGDFWEKYGPWAVIAGGSEGTGRSFARQVAARGLNCVLLAKDGPLAQTAEELRSEFAVEVVTAEVDLSAPGAAGEIFAAVGSREVGLFINNAGADWVNAQFLDSDVEGWLALNRINVETMLRCTHRFGAAMRERRRGGILIVNSGACYGGTLNLAVYGAGKAFQLNFAEALWSELRPHSVDVCTIVLGRTDTPGYRHRRAQRGIAVTDTGLASADAVAAQALARLPEGPISNFGLDDEQAGPFPAAASQRRARVVAMEAVVLGADSGKREDGR